MEEQGVPVFLLGRAPTHAVKVLPLLLPDIDVVHFCDTPEAVRKELPTLLAGKPVQPETGVGSNVERGTKPRLPKVLIVGGGFTEEVYGTLRKDIDIPEPKDRFIWTKEKEGEQEGLDDPNNWTTSVKANGEEFRAPKPNVIAKSIKMVVQRALNG